MTTESSPRLGIVSGGGALPRLLAESCLANGQAYEVFGIRGFAGDWIAEHPSAIFGIWELDVLLDALVRAECQDVCFAGSVIRPAFQDAPPAAPGDKISRLSSAFRRGDDALLRTLAALFEEKGLRVVGVQECLPEFLASPGPVVAPIPDPNSAEDISRGRKIVEALGKLDIGQAAVVAEGRCLAVEVTDGTDAMLLRVADMDELMRAGARRGHGVLVKASKPGQDLRLDMPTVGSGTVELAAAAGLAGIAIEAGAVIMVDRSAVVEEAKKSGLFVFAYSGDEM